MIDAAFQEVPRQRSTRKENKKIQKTETAMEDQPDAKKAQKDTDARWTKKRERRYFGYKNHVNVDRTHKFIHDYRVTPKQKERNRRKSRVRSRVEHVFGIMSKLAQES